MMMPFSSEKDVVVFDLDDTLYYEIEFLKSGYQVIASYLQLDVAKEMLVWYQNGENVFRRLIDKYGLSITVDDLIDIYRFHTPSIKLRSDAAYFIEKLRQANVAMGIITDGRSITQRNKIKALGLDWINDVIISEEVGSEKPSKANYIYFESKFAGFQFTYIGDNPKKDFITPNQLSWNTICILDNGSNIHKQNLEISPEYQAKHLVADFLAIEI